jgi:hypothetical protein
MTTDRTADGALSPELEAIVAAAHDGCTRRPGRTYPPLTRPGVASPRPPAPRSPPAPASAQSPTPNTMASYAPDNSSAQKCSGR